LVLNVHKHKLYNYAYNVKYEDCHTSFTKLKLGGIQCLQKVLNYTEYSEVLKAQNYTSQVT